MGDRAAFPAQHVPRSAVTRCTQTGLDDKPGRPGSGRRRVRRSRTAHSRSRPPQPACGGRCLTRRVPRTRARRLPGPHRCDESASGALRGRCRELAAAGLCRALQDAQRVAGQQRCIRYSLKGSKGRVRTNKRRLAPLCGRRKRRGNARNDFGNGNRGRAGRC